MTDFQEHGAPNGLTAVKSHLFRMWHAFFARFPEMRQQLGECTSLEQFKTVAAAVEAKARAAFEANDVGELEMHTTVVSGARQALPFWFSQPHPRNFERDKLVVFFFFFF